MKKLLIYSTIILTTAASCNKKLNIEPQDSVSEDVIFTTDANVKKALNGAYDAASNGYAYGGDLQLYSELLATETVNGEIRWDGTYQQPREIFTKSILTNNSYVAQTWLACYRAINICNGILANLSIVNAADRGRVEGEARFLRGSMYFEMVKLFAKPYKLNKGGTPGMSLITTPTVGDLSEVNYVPRSTVQQTYDLVLTDLIAAKSLLPESNRFYATASTAAAQLSRVYLQTEEWAKARDEANFALNNGDYDLTSTYGAAFNNEENSEEDLFAIQVNSQDGDNDMHLFWSIEDFGARDGDVDVLQKHMNLYSTSDARYKFFYKDGSVWRSGKWALQYRNIPIIRLAEMYLTRAETNFRLGTFVGATPFDDISDIRGRSGLGTTAGYITLSNILLERKLELAHEGQAIHDIKRTGGKVGDLNWDANGLVLPIPIREINAVGKSILQQNEGY